MDTYTVSYTRRQILVTTSDGDYRRLFPRSDKGAAAMQRYVARLRAVGYTEQAPPPDAFAEIRAMLRGEG